MKALFAIIFSGIIGFYSVDSSSAQIINFSGTMLGSNVVGGISPSGSGSFTATYMPSTQVLNVNGTYSGMTSNVTAAHVHIGVAGVNGGVALGLTQTGGVNGNLSGSGTLSADNVAALINNGLYINVHTANNGGGEIRDQVTLTDALTFDGLMNAANVPSQPASQGTGTFQATYDPPTGILSVTGDYTGMTSNVTVAHVHDGAAGQTGGVVVGLATTGGTSGTFSGSGFAGQLIDGSQLIDLLNDGLYINVHTENNPASEIRDQLNLAIAALPVELRSFDAISRDDEVILTWTTSSELNNHGFEIQHRRIGDWQRIGFEEGHGTSTETQYYTYSISGLEPGSHLFRLKQIDFDGKFEHSPITNVFLDLPNPIFVSEAYPNPFNRQTVINLISAERQNMKVEVYDLLGQKRQVLLNVEVQANEAAQISFEGSDYPAGVYLLRVSGERGHVETRSVTLIK